MANHCPTVTVSACLLLPLASLLAMSTSTTSRLPRTSAHSSPLPFTSHTSFPSLPFYPSWCTRLLSPQRESSFCFLSFLIAISNLLRRLSLRSKRDPWRERASVQHVCNVSIIWHAFLWYLSFVDIPYVLAVLRADQRPTTPV